MEFFKSVIRNVGQMSRQLLPMSPVTNQEVGLTYSTQQDPNEQEAIYPNWFFSSRIGQPRKVDTRKIRELAQSAWVQMVISTFKKQIQTIEWDIVSEDEEDETNREADIKKCMDFFMHINDNKQDVDDINSEAITDIAEIDAGVFNYVYTSDSYVIGEIPIYNAWGQEKGKEVGLVLKPLGQRQLVSLKTVDGSSMLKNVDIHKNLLNYWQYSFKHPKQNPTRFEKDEIEYLMMNPRPYDIYGFSPMQSIQQVVELLIQGTRYNKDLYTNNAVPDLLVSLPKMSKSDLRKIKRAWNNRYQGKPHQVGFINWLIDKIHKLNDTNRDLEWLDGQKWYFRLVFGVYGVSPEEAGFTEDSTKATGDSQERVTIRNALKPYLKTFEQVHTRKTISEILGREDHGLKFKYFPKDHVAEKIEFEQQMKEIEVGALTINDYRKAKGKEPYDWGDEQYRQSSFGFNDFNNDNSNENNPVNSNNQNADNKNKIFKKKFEVFLNDRQQATNRN